MENTKPIKTGNFYKHKDYGDIVKITAIDYNIIFIEPILKKKLIYCEKNKDYFGRVIFREYFIDYPQANTELWKALNQ